MRRALFWTGVALTIALVGFGILYYVHDDYPFQLTPSEILSIGGSRGDGSWVDANGVATAPVGVQVGQAFLWYLRGVGDALATGRHSVTPRLAPTTAPSPAGTP